MDEEITYLVAYACPGCKAPLQGRADRPDPWLRCPKCGRASQPPGPEGVVQRTPRPATATAAGAGGGEERHVIPAPREPRPMTPVATALPDRSARRGVAAASSTAPASSSARGVGKSPALPPALAQVDDPAPRLDLRVAFASGVFVSTTFLLFAFLEQSPTGVLLFASLLLAFIVALLLASR